MVNCPNRQITDEKKVKGLKTKKEPNTLVRKK